MPMSVTDWNAKAGEIVVSAKLGTPPANRATWRSSRRRCTKPRTQLPKRYDADGPRLEVAPGASVEAAIAAANRAALAQLVPSQKTSIDAAYEAALSAITDGRKGRRYCGRRSGGRKTLARRAGDGAAKERAYRPHTTPGVYRSDGHSGVLRSTANAMADDAAPRSSVWPPQAQRARLWRARDYNEVKTLCAKSSHSVRTR